MIPVQQPGPTGEVLAPLAERYAHWLSLDAAQVLADREEAVADIRAMQLVLRMERADPPSWHRAVALAAGGAAAICLDERTAPGGEWHDAVADYVRGHIRKVVRRARGAHWAAAQDLPGLTLESAGTQVRLLVPGPAAELDPRISRLQVGGTDVAPDDPLPGADPTGALHLWVPAGIPMTVGKAMAQAGHAGMICAALLGRHGADGADGADETDGAGWADEVHSADGADGAGGADRADWDGRQRLARWRDRGYPVAVGRLDPAAWTELRAPLAADQEAAWLDQRLLAVRDAGFTEVDPGTITVIARAPD
ncbi:MAG TPA: peptidyl-tRNA hydrolase [Nakamurella sp.]